MQIEKQRLVNRRRFTLSLIDIAEILDHVARLIESMCFTPKQTVVYIRDDILKTGLKLVWFPNVIAFVYGDNGTARFKGEAVRIQSEG